MNELIKVVQLPVIEEQLRSMKEAVDKRVEEALSLVCTEETIQTVKSARAELNKEFQALEEQRKEVKKAVLGPYERFEAVYKECVSDAFKTADAALKGKVEATEREINSAARTACGSISQSCAPPKEWILPGMSRLVLLWIWRPPSRKRPKSCGKS